MPVELFQMQFWATTEAEIEKECRKWMRNWRDGSVMAENISSIKLWFMWFI